MYYIIREIRFNINKKKCIKLIYFFSGSGDVIVIAILLPSYPFTSLALTNFNKSSFVIFNLFFNPL